MNINKEKKAQINFIILLLLLYLLNKYLIIIKDIDIKYLFNIIIVSILNQIIRKIYRISKSNDKYFYNNLKYNILYYLSLSNSINLFLLLLLFCIIGYKIENSNRKGTHKNKYQLYPMILDEPIYLQGIILLMISIFY